MPRISIEKRSRIHTLHQMGFSTREVAVQEGVNQSSVVRICKKFNETGNFDDRPKSGRPKSLSERYERKLLRYIRSEECSTAVEVQSKFRVDEGIVISAETIRRIFRKNGLVARTKKKKPYLKKTHRKKRLEWAKKYKNWTVEDWRKVIWSDESKFLIFNSDGRQYCWKKPTEPLKDQHVIPTVKFGGGGVMVWSCFTTNGVGNLVNIEGIMNADLYCQILDGGFVTTLSRYNLDKDHIFFQQDNDPKHTSKKAKKWFRDNSITLLDWPAQSPDLNLIEDLWNKVDKHLRNNSNPAYNRDTLWENLKSAWDSIETNYCNKLINTMPERVKDVIKARGGYTRW